MGKTKQIISECSQNGGTATFKFKDEVCTDADGTFNPGANEAGGLKIDGMGRACMMLSQHFFNILGNKGATTHFRCIDAEAGTMTVTKLKIIMVEFIWRRKAWGSFCKRYGVEQGKVFEGDGLIEVTLKDDALGDPLINKEACIALGLITEKQYDKCIQDVKDTAYILEEELKKHDYELIDFKMEFGIDESATDEKDHMYQRPIIADEISPSIWRILDRSGNTVDPIEAARKICG
jgi:phosphoribosylaminoimidazole-succinocarboxamide synthase